MAVAIIGIIYSVMLYVTALIGSFVERSASEFVRISLLAVSCGFLHGRLFFLGFGFKTPPAWECILVKVLQVFVVISIAVDFLTRMHGDAMRLDVLLCLFLIALLFVGQLMLSKRQSLSEDHDTAREDEQRE